MISPEVQHLFPSTGELSRYSLFAQQLQDGHLDDGHRVVRYPEPGAEVRVLTGTALAPRDVGHFAENNKTLTIFS